MNPTEAESELKRQPIMVRPGEACRILNVSDKTLIKRAKKYRVTVYRTEGGQRRYDRECLLRMLVALTLP